MFLTPGRAFSFRVGFFLTAPQPGVPQPPTPAPHRGLFLGCSLASCQRVGAEQAWAHQALQLLLRLPSPWAETGMGPNRQAAWLCAQGEWWAG